jgi:hypothetical protein
MDERMDEWVEKKRMNKNRDRAVSDKDGREIGRVRVEEMQRNAQVHWFVESESR